MGIISGVKGVVGVVNGSAMVVNMAVGVPVVAHTGGTDSPAAPAVFIGAIIWFVVKVLLGDDEAEKELERQQSREEERLKKRRKS